MYYGTIKTCDIANGIGVRVSLFVSGCTNRCKGCFQPETWDFCYGQPFDRAAEELILAELQKPYIDGLTMLGGEPMEPENQRALLPFLREVKRRFPEKSVWCFSGFTLDEMKTEGAHPRCECTDELLSLIDVLVDGRFEEEKKDISLRFRGSSNQRVLDLKSTLAQGRPVLWTE